MITFEWTSDINETGETVWFIGVTDCTGDDRQHSDEIYQQLDAEVARLA